MDLFWCKFEHKNFEGITEETKNQIASDVILTLNESGLIGICSKYDYLRETYPRLSEYSDDSSINDNLSYYEGEETSEVEETLSKNFKNEDISSTSDVSSTSTKRTTLFDPTTIDAEFITYTDLFNIFVEKTKQTAKTFLFGEW